MRACTWALLIAALALGGCGGDDDGSPSDTPGSGGGGSGAGGSHGAGSGGAGSAGSPASGGAGGAGKGASGMGGSAGDAAGSGGVAAHDAGTPDAAPIGGDAAGAPLRLAIRMKAVPAGQEDHVCVTLPLPNDATAWLKSIHATLTAGSHHLIVDRHPVGSAIERDPTPCSPTMGGDATRLIIAQQPDTRLDMPEGTALRVEAHQPIFLQLHYINLKETAADIEGVVELELADAGAGTPTEVQSVFSGALSIDLPKHQAGESEYFVKPNGTKSAPLHVFALTSHTHSLGVEATIERVSDRQAPDTTPIHVSTDWQEPPLTRFDPPLEFTGEDGLRLRCKYMNTTDLDVHFGTRFEDEMCFMWIYYY
jgi:hypothetical protein